MILRQDCEQIVRQAIAAVQPDEAVRRALEGRAFPAGRLVLVSATSVNRFLPSEAVIFNWLQAVTVSFPSSFRRFFVTFQ